MITLYGLSEQEWLNLAVIAGWEQIVTMSLLDIKNVYYRPGAMNTVKSGMTETACRHYMTSKLSLEIASLGCTR